MLFLPECFSFIGTSQPEVGVRASPDLQLPAVQPAHMQIPCIVVRLSVL